MERMKDPSLEKPDIVNTECMLFGVIHFFTGCACVYVASFPRACPCHSSRSHPAPRKKT